MEGSYILQQQAGNAPIQVASPMAAEPSQTSQQGNVSTLHQGYPRKRTCLHNCSLLLDLAVIGAALNMILGQIWGIWAVQGVQPLELVVRVYTMCLSILVVFNELEWPSLVRDSPIIHKYLWRGLFYSFLGILCVMMSDIGNDAYYNSRMSKYANYNNNNFTIYIPTHEQAAELYLKIASWSMVGFGVVYVVLGLLRIQRVVERHKEEYRLSNANYGVDTTKRPGLCGVMA